MDLDDLCKLLVEHGLVDREEFRPDFTGRIMREGGEAVLRNQDADIAANIKLFEDRIRSCIQQYSPEKVETYFYLQELANHARKCFYEGVNEDSREEDNSEEKRKFTDQDRKKLKERLMGLKVGFYKSGELGEPIGLTSASVGRFLSHLSDDKREEYRIRYGGTKKRTWEKY